MRKSSGGGVRKQGLCDGKFPIPEWPGRGRKGWMGSINGNRYNGPRYPAKGGLRQLYPQEGVETLPHPSVECQGVSTRFDSGLGTGIPPSFHIPPQRLPSRAGRRTTIMPPPASCDSRFSCLKVPFCLLGFGCIDAAVDISSFSAIAPVKYEDSVRRQGCVGCICQIAT
jgi:hypothetical protein